jgi:hypothetical protein
MITQIIWLFSWPLLIVLSFHAVKWSLRKFEQKMKDK